MATADKILNKITELSRDLDRDWEDELTDINIWNDVSALYFKFDTDNRKANIILTYIVRAYSKNSEWLHMHMDRMENKIKIFEALGGKGCMEDQDYTDAATGIQSPYNEIVEFYINYQKDQRWRDIVSYYDYHSKASAMLSMANDEKSMDSVGRTLNLATQLREKADQLVAQIEKENVVIDGALRKEKRPTLSDRRGEDFMSHEVYIRGLKSAENKEEIDEDGDFMTQYQ